VPPDFAACYGRERLPDIARYAKALGVRGQRGRVNPEKEAARAARVKVFSDRLHEIEKGLSPDASCEKIEALKDFFFMLEEFKVSLFAQEQKTAFPVSAKRLEARLNELEDL
jgi:ATP-dependent helicase HrpA